MISLRARRVRSAGFTAVEVMNFVALAVVLSTVGMYVLARYVRYGKTTEAVSSLGTLAASAAEYYNGSDATQPAGAAPQSIHAMRHFPSSSQSPVPEDRGHVRGQRYQSNLSDWSPSPWRELHFSIVQPQCYQYSFESQGFGAVARATITAEGDLDGDGLRSSYTLSVAPDDTLAAQPSKEIVKKDPEE